MKTYICKDELLFMVLREEGFLKENEEILVDKDTLRNLIECSFLSEVRSENDNGMYLDLPKEFLKENFEEL